MKYSNFNKKYILIFKLLLCLYILLSPYVKHDILLQIVNDDGIKTKLGGVWHRQSVKNVLNTDINAYVN